MNFRLRRQMQADLSEFEVSLVYRVPKEPRTTKATKRNPAFKTQKHIFQASCGRACL